MFKAVARLRLCGAVLAVLLSMGVGGVADASSGAAPLSDHANIDVSDVASLQRGARHFVSYCMGCHSAKYVRYNRLGEDLQISEQELIKTLMFAAQKPQETMTIAMRPEDATRWFGTPPPDLSLIARSRGADYLYNFLRGFYADPRHANGTNNLMLPNTAMPHILWKQQGLNEAVFESHGKDAAPVFKELRQVVPGALSPQEYDQFVRDIVAFLAYIGEPMQLDRQRLGFWVLGFLLVFGILSYLLKVEIWKDVR